MKTTVLQALLLTALTATPLAALADHDDDYRGSRAGAVEWRLGDRNQIFMRAPGDRQWRRAPGSALDIADGWVIGTDRRNGGYGIYRWSGYGWQRMPGAAVEIGGSFANPWVVNDRGERFRWNGYDWRREASYSGRGRNDRDRDERYERDDWRNGFRDNDRDDRRGANRVTERGERRRDDDRRDERDYGDDHLERRAR